jgi:thiol:disulfide interchange protein DsbD
VTAPLVGVLMYIGQTGDQLLGATALFAMGIGMGIPLLLIGLSAGRWLPKAGPWMVVVKQIFGMLMLAMAIWMFSRVAQQTIILILWSSYLLGIAVFLAFILPRVIKKEIINRSLGLVFGLSGMLVMFTAADNSAILYSITRHSQKTNSQMTARSFTIVRDLSDFNRYLLIAKTKQQPVLLDFYADWCESCITMDTHVFNKVVIQQALSRYMLLRVNLTANNEKDQALLKYFGVIAPPTMLFFNTTGVEVNSKRIVGELNSKEFLENLQDIEKEIALK